MMIGSVDTLTEKETEVLILGKEEASLLENLLKALKIDLKDFLEIRKVKDYKKAMNKKIKELEGRCETLEKELTNQRTNIIQLNNRLSNLEMKKANEEVFNEFPLNNADDEDD